MFSIQRPPLRLLLALIVVVLIAAAWGIPRFAGPLVANRVRAAARSQGMDATWQRLSVQLPPRVRIDHLVLRSRAHGDTVMRADSLAVSVPLSSILTFHPRVGELRLARARIVRIARSSEEPEDVAPAEAASATARDRPPARRVLRAARSLARMLLLPARDLPRLALHDIAITTAAEDSLGELVADASNLGHLHWLTLEPAEGGVRLSAAGDFRLDERVPFEADLAYHGDDHLQGWARFDIRDPEARASTPFTIEVDGHVTQDRGAGVLRIADDTRVRMGDIPFTLAGSIGQRGPSIALRLAADGLTQARVTSSIPRPVLGPLTQVFVRGSWDYRLGLDIDLARLADVDFSADVIPHGLALDEERTSLRLTGLDQPFTAEIHLPHDRIVTRDVSPANPHFRTLDRIDSTLAHAVVTNEDGGFFRHRGFNTSAVKDAIADNLRAGTYKRGAGTITMQLARNLYLGHARTLSRKGQEVVLAWMLEHMSGATKQRLLEIYLNIIEWGPGVHGADEAATFYFGTSAERLTLEQALFLTVLIPSPSKWQTRLDAAGNLQPGARAQMHFIGRAMIAKGFIPADALPPRDSLRVTLFGPARDIVFPPDSAMDHHTAALITPDAR